MRNFADVVRLPAPKKSTIDLNQLVRAVIVLMEIKAGEKQVRFIDHLAAIPIYISGDEQQLEQVLINIVKNALESIEGSGEIIFTSLPAEKRLTVTDTGKGISEQFSTQLFSPLFSTKKDGQGIGLTLVKEILHYQGCEFSLQTIQPGETNFVIQFKVE